MEWIDYCREAIPEIKAKFLRIHGYELDIEHPVTFTEKLQWLKVYDSTYMKAMCADKIKVHQYYTKMLGKDIGVPIIKVYDNVDDIHDIKAPCVLKFNHGSGMNIVLRNGKDIDMDDITTKVNKWYNTDHGKNWNEMYYSLIKPTLFTEQYLPDMYDVKVFCFNGQPKFCQYDKHFAEKRQNFYDLEWKPLKWLSRKDYPANYDIYDAKPDHFDQILEYTKILCRPFKLVRCDFIISGGTVYGGELTFIPGAGNQTYFGDADNRLGNMLDLQ